MSMNRVCEAQDCDRPASFWPYSGFCEAHGLVVRASRLLADELEIVQIGVAVITPITKEEKQAQRVRLLLDRVSNYSELLTKAITEAAVHGATDKQIAEAQS